MHHKITQTLLIGNSLKDISVELFLSVSQELANHLPTQAFPLEQEVGHTHRSLWNKVSLYQILDAFFWFSGDIGEGRGRERDKKGRSEDTVQICDYPTALLPLAKCVSDEGQDLGWQGGSWLNGMTAQNGEEGASFLCSVHNHQRLNGITQAHMNCYYIQYLS